MSDVTETSGANRTVELATPSEFSVRGMNCQNCVRHVTEAIQGVAGVASAVVQLEGGRATVRWRAGAAVDPQAIIAAVKGAGYETEIVQRQEARGERRERTWSPLESWRFNVVLGLAATAPLMVGEWVFGLGMTGWFQWASFALALPVQVLCGARFYRGAWSRLKIGGSNMDTLVALGSTTAFVYSAWGLFSGWGGHLYFMEAAAIITLISVGHWLESIASARAESSLKTLLNLAPQVARKLDADGREVEAPVAELAAEDRVVLKPGDRVPVDGAVLEGASAVDESMLTGESLPVEKAAGARLYAGTLNQNGRLVMQVTATGEATALAQIIAVVQRAQTSRANIQKLGDRVSSVFVPLVVLVALGTALGWGLAPTHARGVALWLMQFLWPVTLPATALAAAVVHAAGVLIVACPCAMGLATPAAIMAGTNAAARRGILIRDGIALEKTGTITAVVFDKTGTLTHGKLSVAAVEDFRGKAERATPLERIAASLAEPSNHPLSRAVVAFGALALAGSEPAAAALCTQAVPEPPEGGTPNPSEWEELRGCGVQARAGQTTLRLGSLAWLRECGVKLAPAEVFEASWSRQGATVLGLAAEDRLLGALALRDSLKPHASDVVTQLGRRGKRVFLLTGDNARTAAAIAQAAGIAPENVFAEVRPERKAEIVKTLQERGERVAFVGDGINDAPALEQAELGIAVSRASDVAREAADIILLRSDIDAVPEALALAHATLRTIKQNLFWAFFYNAAAVPLAALGFLSPVLCAAAMGLSDLIVIGNALRLLRWRFAIK
jgi:Cu+-exporting ATPase